MGDELLDLQGLALGRVALQGDGFLRTPGDAHATAHASRSIDVGESVIHGNRRELAIVGAQAASSAQLGFHPGHKARRGQHRRAALRVVGLHRPAAAGAAVADGVKAPEHGIFVLVDTINQIRSP
jgi:hypothetical protein